MSERCFFLTHPHLSSPTRVLTSATAADASCSSSPAGPSAQARHMADWDEIAAEMWDDVEEGGGLSDSSLPPSSRRHYN